jgi:putative transcriptional regulator
MLVLFCASSLDSKSRFHVMINDNKNQPQNKKTHTEENVAAIKLIREELGMTQLEFAVALGMNPATISRTERGMSEPLLTAAQWKKLCQLTGKSAQEIPDYLGKKLTN